MTTQTAAKSGATCPFSLKSTEGKDPFPIYRAMQDAGDIVWDAFRFVVVPKGLDPARKRWLEAAFNTALSDPDIAAEFAALGATVDRRLASAAQVAEEVERRATRERNYYLKTGRLK